jgi:hypothetical protein
MTWRALPGAGSVRGYKTSTIKRITRHGSPMKAGDAGSEDLIQIASGVYRGRLLPIAVLKRVREPNPGGLCVRQMHKSAQFPAQPCIMADFQGKP